MSTNKNEKLLWDSSEFTKMYQSAEKLTGVYGKLLLEQAGLNATSGAEKLVVLDNACGTGVVSANLMDMLSDESKDHLELTCADLADSMVDFVQKRSASSGWKGTRVVKADGQDTKLAGAHYTHILVNFGPMVFPNPSAAIQECHRMLRPGGVLGVSTWQKIGWLPDIRAAFATTTDLPPFPSDDRVMKASSSDGHWDDAKWVEKNLADHGFDDVNVQVVPRQSRLENVDEFMMLLPGTVGLIINKFWTAEEKQKCTTVCNETVKKYMRGKYGSGAVVWDWVAILATARKLTRRIG